jgi:cytochrome c oxidase cbb3-type subunit III
MRLRSVVIPCLLTMLVAVAAHRTRAAQSASPSAAPAQSTPATAAQMPAPASPQQGRRSTAEELAAYEAAKAERRARGAVLYAKYCTECHGTRGEGHIADNANSLRSRSFLATVSPLFLDSVIRYGRPGTAMAAYHESLGGPLPDADIKPLVDFIQTLDTVKHVNPGKPGQGDPQRGKRIYRARCEQCHGPQGKGPLAPSLNDPLFLMEASQPFLRYAITEGRDGTTMPSFRDVLTAQEIEDVTAHIVSWSRRWIKPGTVRLKPTSLAQAVLSPNGPPPEFGALREDLYITPVALKNAVDRGSRLVLLDARPPSAWAVRHIPGAVPLPYFEAEAKAALLPNDGTWIVAYCECPTSLAKRVITTLRAKGFTRTAVLDEGLAGWVGRRFPLTSGIVDEPDPKPTPPTAQASSVR